MSGDLITFGISDIDGHVKQPVLAILLHTITSLNISCFIPAFYRVAITMSVSAYWHGVFPGYYLSFLLVPVILLAEDAMMAAFRHGSEKRKEMFDWACWFFKMRGFDYMCMGFLLLRLDYTLAYWKSIFFLGHVVTIIFLVTGKLFYKKPPKTEEQKS